MFFFKAAVSQKTFSLSTDVFIFFCSTIRQFVNAFPHPHPLALVVNKSPGHSISIQLCTTISKEKKKGPVNRLENIIRFWETAHLLFP